MRYHLCRILHPMTDLINRKRPNLFDPSVQLAPASSSSSKAIKDSNSYSNQTLQDIDESKNSNITRTKVNDMKIANESRGSTKHQNIGNQDIRVDFSQLHHAREILQTFETRHYSVMYEHLILTRENLGLQNRLSSVKQSYSVVNQSVQRACDSVECLQTLVKGIEKRLVNIKKFKGQVEERVFSLSNLLDSVQAAKSKMVRKIATLEHEALDLRKNTVSNERKFQVDLDTVNTANGLLREEIKNLEANRSELVKDMSEKSKIMEEMKAYINELKSTIDTSKSEYSKKLELVDLNMNSQIKVSRDLLTSLSIALKTQAPSSFGDSSMAALTNVMEEILCEHTVMVNSEKKEIQVTLDHLAGRLDTETELLKNSNKENGEILLKINLLQNDVEQKKADILTLESSIQAFQKESGQTAAKLADLQRIKIIANIVEDILGVNGKCIDYEEMRCLLLERFNHTDCRVKIEAYQEKCEMAAKSIVSLEKSLEESVEREKRLKLELKTTLAKIKDSVGSQPSSSQCVINAGKDHEETLSHLIDLVEKDNNMTQEKDLGNLYKFKSSKRLRRQTEKKPAGISSSSSTTRSSVVISRKSPPLSASNTKQVRKSDSQRAAGSSLISKHMSLNRRSPLSNVSEFDLWSVFAKHG